MRALGEYVLTLAHPGELGLWLLNLSNPVAGLPSPTVLARLLIQTPRRQQHAVQRSRKLVRSNSLCCKEGYPWK